MCLKDYFSRTEGGVVSRPGVAFTNIIGRSLGRYCEFKQKFCPFSIENHTFQGQLYILSAFSIEISGGNMAFIL